MSRALSCHFHVGSLHAASERAALSNLLASPMQVFDRVAKGVREAPSKALIGELAAASGEPPAAAFSLRQSLSTLGALAGAAVAAAAFKLSGGQEVRATPTRVPQLQLQWSAWHVGTCQLHNVAARTLFLPAGHNYMLTFALALLPAGLALLLVLSAFGAGGHVPLPVAPACGAEDVAAGPADGEGQQQPAAAGQQQQQQGSRRTGAVAALPLLGKARLLLVALPAAYWQALAVVAILYMARFDVAWLNLRAAQVHACCAAGF